jgi:hypothetical protein
MRQTKLKINCVLSHTMKQLTTEELHLNESGTLSDLQFSHLKRYGYSQLVVAGIFVVLVIVSVLMTNMKFNWLSAIWIGAGALFASIYIYTATGYLKIKKEGNVIQKVSGTAEIKESGNRHRLLRIGEQRFFLLKNQSAGIENGKVYTVYYLDNPRSVTGWMIS